MEGNFDIKLISFCFVLLFGFSSCSMKKGLALWGDEMSCDDIKLFGNMSWWYDWRNDISKYNSRLQNCGVDSFLDRYIPMIWSGARWYMKTVTNFPTAAQYVMGFNEPNHQDQANMSATEAANLWPTIEQHAGNRLLVSPSVPCGNCRDGHSQWYDEFFRLCKGCRVDVLSTHMYGCNADHTMQYLENMYHRYGKKIWLTEFACPHDVSAQVQLHYMKQILPRLEAAHFIEKYSWFMARLLKGGWVQTTATLLEPHSATLTPLGRFYRDFHSNTDAGAIIG